MVQRRQGFVIDSTPVPPQIEGKKKDPVAFRVLFWIGCFVLFTGAFGLPITLLVFLILGIVKTVVFITKIQSRLKTVEENTQRTTTYHP
jgi:uncharacterized membrane protein